MGAEPFLIASTVKAVVGQRLVRRLNHKTRIAYEPSVEEQNRIKAMFGLKPEDSFKPVHDLVSKAASLGPGGDTPISTDENGIKTLWKADETDNKEESHGGFRGRVGIYELLITSKTIQKLIMSNATSEQIEELAVSEGMIPMQTDGLIKALRGETTIEEVMRVSKE